MSVTATTPRIGSRARAFSALAGALGLIAWIIFFANYTVIGLSGYEWIHTALLLFFMAALVAVGVAVVLVSRETAVKPVRITAFLVLVAALVRAVFAGMEIFTPPEGEGSHIANTAFFTLVFFWMLTVGFAHTTPNSPGKDTRNLAIIVAIAGLLGTATIEIAPFMPDPANSLLQTGSLLLLTASFTGLPLWWLLVGLRGR